MEKRRGNSTGQEDFQSPQNSSRELPIVKSDSSQSRFAYLGNGDVPDRQPPSLGEQLWQIYGKEEGEVISDGTLQHEISRVIHGEDIFYSRKKVSGN